MNSGCLLCLPLHVSHLAQVHLKWTDIDGQSGRPFGANCLNRASKGTIDDRKVDSDTVLLLKRRALVNVERCCYSDSSCLKLLCFLPYASHGCLFICSSLCSLLSFTIKLLGFLTGGVQRGSGWCIVAFDAISELMLGMCRRMAFVYITHTQ